MPVSKFIFAAFLVLFSFGASAQQFNYTAFAKIPVAHEGRIKPLGRYASLLQSQVTHETPFSDTKSASWLANIFFDPSGAANQPIFVLKNKNLAYALELAVKETYSFNELNKAFLKKKDLLQDLQQSNNLTNDQNKLLDLYVTVAAFEQTKDALSSVLPLQIDENQKGPVTFGDLNTKKKLSKKEKWLYDRLHEKGQYNSFLRLIPIGKDWLSPWQVTLDPRNPTQKILHLWRDLAHAYIDHDVNSWLEISNKIHDETLSQANDPSLKFRLTIENFYQSLHPFLLAFLLFITAILFLSFKEQRSAHGLTLAALFFHGVGILGRIVILQRPPVSTLYESTLFVGFAASATCYLLFRQKRKKIFLAISCLIAVLNLALGYAIQDNQDSMRVLEAVLNTRLWLGTHVLAITFGYAVSLLTGIMAHCYLIGHASKKETFLRSPVFFSVIYKFSLLSLLFVGGGTLLGGVWADQSWGRFWGWDPKENGALLIALWLTWLLHAKVEKRFDETAFTLGLALLLIVIGFSWIGVNLLGVGLHAYGFTQGLSWIFASFCIIDIMFIIFLWRKIKR